MLIRAQNTVVIRSMQLKFSVPTHITHVFQCPPADFHMPLSASLCLQAFSGI